MNGLWLPLALLLLTGCAGVAVEEPPQQAAQVKQPAVFPDQEEPPRQGTVEAMLRSQADVLELTSNDVIRLQVQHRKVDIHPPKEELDVFVIQLLHSLRKYEGRGGSSGLTLQDIEAVTLLDTDQGIPEPGLPELARAYRDVLETNEEPAVRVQAQHRLADIKLLEGEAALSGDHTEDSGAYFAESIRDYEGMLRANPDYPFNDQLLYQLAKAYALSGANDESIAVLGRLSSEYPDSTYVPEAEFRRAESYFAAADYSRADLAYSRVVGYGEASHYYLNALYMQGWSRLKEGAYRRAIEPFSATLDRVMPSDNDMEAMERGEREIALDCLRALAVIFSQLDGAQSIAQTYNLEGPRTYQALVYLQLGDLYLAQERYGDSAETYKFYTRSFPDASDAPRIQMRVIESYESGGFTALMVQEKQLYLERFAFDGAYWQSSGETERAEIRAQLKQFTEELANHHHALAQQESKPGGDPGVATEHYLAAISYYQLFVQSFPEDDRVPAMGFLLGESRFEAGDYPGAISAYEWVAYDFSAYERAADAGYAAILAYERLGREAGAAASQQRIASERRFAATFGSDPRAVPVLEQAATALLQLGEFEQVAELASVLIAWQPAPDAARLQTAGLLLGHSLFELRRYRDAELAYQDVLAGLPAEDERYSGTVDRLAASIYRQGELAAQAGDNRAAAQQFERVIAAAPSSSIRINAQFDAAMNYSQVGALEQANDLLLDFRNRFPDNALAASVRASLVSNYEQLEQWQAAAIELDGIAASQAQGERKRQALYLSAVYYDRSGAHELAIARYGSYAKSWPQPFATHLEAMNRLAELYQQTGQTRKQHFWLAEIIASHDQAGAEQSERSVYLAALSASNLADYEFQRFSAIKLGYPIKVSLGQKKTAMERAVAAYQKAGAYGLQQFSTLSTYRIGRIYQQLSTDLISSDRPDKLDAMALEQYEVLLEEQAYPFEEKAIAIYQTNTRRTRDGLYDAWVRKSFNALGELLPVRYQKVEASIGYGGEIY